MRAHIHHIDGNPANNPEDGSNWEILCSICHNGIPKEKGNHNGIYIVSLFAPWKRAEILVSKGNRCNRCGMEIYPGRYTNKPRPICYLCGRIIELESDRILWRDGKIMCRQCFDEMF